MHAGMLLARLHLRDEHVILHHTPDVMIVIARHIDDLGIEPGSSPSGNMHLELHEAAADIAERRQAEIERIAHQHQLHRLASAQLARSRSHRLAEARQHRARLLDHMRTLAVGQQAVVRAKMEVGQYDSAKAHAPLSSMHA